MSGFFDRFPVFYTSTDVGAYANRLNNRHRAIFGPVLEDLEGASVLDLGSHDGRWSLAAIEAGARHVLGVEPRAELVQKARGIFEDLQVDPDRYAFEKWDMMGLRELNRFDVVLCLGVLYHTDQCAELLRLCCRWAGNLVVLDTRVNQQPISAVHYELEGTANAGNAYGSGSQAMVGIPSIPFIDLCFRFYGFDPVMFRGWKSEDLVEPGNWKRIEDYEKSQRVTMTARARRRI